MKWLEILNVVRVVDVIECMCFMWYRIDYKVGFLGFNLVEE